MKFEEAYLDINSNDKVKDIFELTLLYEQNEVSFLQKYGKHLFCPECRKAQLVFVDAQPPYLRTAPHAVHEQGCSLTQPEMSVSAATTFVEDTDNYEEILRQIKRVLATAMGKKITTPEKKQIHKRNNVHSETSDIEFKTSKEVKRFPHKRIDAPFREEDFNCYKIFYGNVDYCWEPDKQKGKILLYRTNENKLLCKITVSKGVAKYLPEKYKTVKRTSYTVAFVAKFDLNNNQCKSYLTTYLRYSNYFILDKGAALA